MALDYLGRTLDVDDLMADLDQQAEEVQDTRGHLVTLQGVADRVQRIVEAAETVHGRLEDRDDALAAEYLDLAEKLRTLAIGAGVQGDPGPSAYDLARAAGFDGSVQDWLASLRGQDGHDSTVPGPAGLSAFELAQLLGWSGTEEEWLASLHGQAGEDGADSTVPGPAGPSAYQVAVAAGFSGTPAQWLASLRGSDGRDSTVPGPAGSSAFQLAQAAGFTGTPAQWLASLRGADGKDSTVPGPASTVPGPAGLTAFQVAQAAGYTGTVEQWLASLKGKDGTSAVVPAKGAGSVKLTSLLGLGATMVLSLELDATPPAGATPFVQTMGAPVYLTAWTRTGTTLQLTLAAAATIALGTTVSAQVRML